MSFRRRTALLCLAGVAAGCATTLPGPPVKELAPSGRLRVAINFGNPILAARGPDGEPFGVSVDLARELGRRLGVQVELVTFTSAGKVVEAVRDAQVDIAFVAIDPVRGADMLQTPPYVIIEGAYLVRSASTSAGVKQQLQADARRIAGLRLLDGRFMVIQQAMGLPRGRDNGARYVSAIVEEMKASGFVAAALKRHGIEGALVAPPGRSAS